MLLEKPNSVCEQLQNVLHSVDDCKKYPVWMCGIKGAKPQPGASAEIRVVEPDSRWCGTNKRCGYLPLVIFAQSDKTITFLLHYAFLQY